MKQYVITRTVDEMRNRRYVTTECRAPTMADVIAMYRLLAEMDARIVTGEALERIAGE